MSAVGQRDGESDRRRTDLTDRSIKHGVLFVLLIYLTPNSFVRAFQNVGGARRGGGEGGEVRCTFRMMSLFGIATCLQLHERKHGVFRSAHSLLLLLSQPIATLSLFFTFRISLSYGLLDVDG